MNKVTIKLNSWQRQVWKDKTRFLVLCCGRRAGKSTYSAIRMLTFARDNPKTVVYYVSPTYKQSKNIMFELIKKYIPQGWTKKVNETELTFEFVNGSRIMLKGADSSPDSLRGVRIDFLVCDEVAFFKNWNTVWENVLRPTLIDSQGSAMFISTPNGYNHFYDMFMQGKVSDSKEWSSYRSTSYDNEYLVRGEIDKAKEDNDLDVFAQEYMAEFKRFRGLVFKDFSKERHVIEPCEIKNNWTFFRSIDFGYVNESACLFAGLDSDNVLYIYDMIYKTGLTTPDLNMLISQKSAGRNFLNTFADSASAGDINELIRYGLGVTPVSKTSGSHNEDWTSYKIRKVSERFRADTVKIFSTCEPLIDELENYRYMEVQEGQAMKEVPAKIHDHAIDALIYLVVSLPEYIQPQGYPKESYPVNKWEQPGFEDMFKIGK